MTDVEKIQEYCQGKHADVTSEFPFDSDTLTMKIGGKIFCFLPLERQPPQISLKGIPDHIAQLKDERESAFNGAYLNSKHWISIYLNGDITPDEIQSLIDTSFDLVVKGLTKKVKMQLGL